MGGVPPTIRKFAHLSPTWKNPHSRHPHHQTFVPSAKDLFPPLNNNFLAITRSKNFLAVVIAPVPFLLTFHTLLRRGYANLFQAKWKLINNNETR